jgi:FlaA1/EpsC-like NDP-sugar epimerase
LAQNFLLSRNIVQSRTKFSAFNYGNVIASKGSVVPYFVFLLKSGQTIPITDVRMSRFWWKIDAAADFVLENYEKAPMDRAMIPPLKGASVVRIVGSLARLLGVKSYEIKTVGLRGTEKIYEVLEANHDQCFRSDTADQYSEGELDDLLQDYAV